MDYEGVFFSHNLMTGSALAVIGPDIWRSPGGINIKDLIKDLDVLISRHGYRRTSRVLRSHVFEGCLSCKVVPQ